MLRIDLLTPLYTVDPTISLGDFERLIMGEGYEVAGVFGRDGRLVLAPKRGGLDAVEFTEEESPYLRGCVLTHNHPSGSAFSYDDMALSVQRDVDELRAVCPDGVVYILERPLGGWPSTETMLEIVERSVKALRAENERRRLSGASILGGRRRDAFMIEAQQKACAEIGVQLGRTDVWRR